MSQKPIRAIFVDAGNTLFTEKVPRGETFHAIAHAHGGEGTADDALDAIARVFEELPASFEGSFRYSLAWFETFNARVMELLDVPESRRADAHRALARHYEDPASYTLFEETTEVLETVANLGLSLGVVSNWSERLPALLEGLGILDMVQFVVTSAEMRSEKPDRAIFERALFRSGVPAAEALHVGDHLERDVCGALSAGLRAALVDRTGAKNGVDGIPVLPDLRGVLALIEQPTHVSRS